MKGCIVTVGIRYQFHACECCPLDCLDRKADYHEPMPFEECEEGISEPSLAS